jgi:signal transduction histidine kinase
VRRARMTASDDPAQSRRGIIVLCYILIIGIVAVDWATPAGIVVGLLLAVPIALLSLLDRQRDIVIGATTALVGKSVAAIYGAPAISPPTVWVTNRILAFACIIAMTFVAVILQRQRLAARQALRAALAARDLNGLLMSLMAHDFRAPLIAASQALEYVQRTVGSGRPVDDSLLTDTRVRLGRNLLTVESVLHMTQADQARQRDVAGVVDHATPVTGEQLACEAQTFREEAAARDKPLTIAVERLGARALIVDWLVLRHALGILLDNAVRHADPGPICVAADRADRSLVIRVSDSGPGLGARKQADRRSAGSGMGLELCKALVARVGGSLIIEQDSPSGSCFRLTVPVRDVL